jgi:hypothetical protein
MFSSGETDLAKVYSIFETKHTKYQTEQRLSKSELVAVQT